MELIGGPSPGYIRRIIVEGLFGQFDHDLRLAENQQASPNLLILYGLNGTGKTTILWLIYHLLSREIASGHRSYLARQRFKRLLVEFSDGTEISASRATDEAGKFAMAVRKAGRPVASYEYEVDKDGSVGIPSPDDSAHMLFWRSLPPFSLSFLPHDRLSEREDEEHLRRRILGRIGARPAEEPPVRRWISLALGTARRRAIRASNEGQHTANTIYTDLVRKIAEVQLIAPPEGEEQQRGDLGRRLEEQSRLFQSYSALGLTPELKADELLATLRGMPFAQFHIAAQVLEPFLRGNSARSDALRPLQVALTTMVESINSLFLNKHIRLHLERGLEIFTLGGEPLGPEQLSSGEQELLVLFCGVLTGLGPGAVLLIDEPEISLNSSWQQRLLDQMLKCAGESGLQFIVATHSIELLARHRGSVVRLSSKPVGHAHPSPRPEGSEG